MNRNGLWLGALALASLLSAPAHAAVCSSIGATVVLVDRTLADREALASETRAAFDKILEEVWNKGESYFDSKLELVYLDDQGEHGPAWQMQFPKRYGMQKSEMKAALGILAERIKSSIAEIRADKKQYASSMLLEGVSQQLKRLGSCDRVVLISDLCVVDKSGNNFERLQFNDPHRLSSKASVELHRLGRPQQPLESIELIEAWWQDALYGDGQFKKLYEAYKVKKNSTESTEDAPKSVRASPPPALRPALLSSQAPSSVARLNEARILGNIAKFKECTNTDGVPKSELGTYRMKIYVEANGQPAKTDSMSGSSKRIKACLGQALMGLKYVLHPAGSSYFFVQEFVIKS